jgi:hypothetical protein
MRGRAYLRVEAGSSRLFLCPTIGRALSVGTPRKEVNVVVSDAWNLVWILPVLVMVYRAVFCPRDEPSERIVAILGGFAGIVGAAAVALREWRR